MIMETKPEGKQQYPNNYPSVTQALSVIRKLGLEWWLKHNTAQFCDEEKKKAAEIGSELHKIIELFIKGQEPTVTTNWGEELHNAVKSFLLFIKENKELCLKESEIRICNDDLKLNGTIDCVAAEKCGDDVIPLPALTSWLPRVIIDWKTSSAHSNAKPSLYPEVLLQMAAYAKLYEEEYKDKTIPVKIVKAVAVSLAKDKVAYNKIEVGSEELADMYESGFKPAYQLYGQLKKLQEKINLNGVKE
jgi:hypothetical protein